MRKRAAALVAPANKLFIYLFIFLSPRRLG